jgi:hypothetical protein
MTTAIAEGDRRGRHEAKVAALVDRAARLKRLLSTSPSSASDVIARLEAVMDYCGITNSEGDIEVMLRAAMRDAIAYLTHSASARGMKDDEVDIGLQSMNATVETYFEFTRFGLEEDWGRVTYDVWNRENRRLCWLADQLKRHMAEVNRAFYGEPAEPPTEPKPDQRAA